MIRPKALPYILLWFVPAPLCFALAYVPGLGGLAFLLLVAAPFIAVTFNIGFISLGVQALRGKIARLWVLAPVMWFGGYAAFALRSNFEIARIDRELQQRNAAATTVFDPSTQDLVVLSNDVNLDLHRLVTRVDVPVVYIPHGNQAAHAVYRAYRLGGRTTCEQVRGDPLLAHKDVHVIDVADGPSGARVKVPGVCLYSLAQSPSRATVTVQIHRRVIDDVLAPRHEFDVQVATPEGDVRTVTFATVGDLGWLPIPKLRWSLFVVPKGPPLRRERERVVGLPIAIPSNDKGYPSALGANYAIAYALSLRVAPPSSRREKLNAQDGNPD